MGHPQMHQQTNQHINQQTNPRTHQHMYLLLWHLLNVHPHMEPREVKECTVVKVARGARADITIGLDLFLMDALNRSSPVPMEVKEEREGTMEVKEEKEEKEVMVSMKKLEATVVKEAKEARQAITIGWVQHLLSTTQI